MPAKKNDDEQINMIGSFREFQDTKHIDRTTLVSVLEESFRNVLAKIFGSDENFDVIVNPDKGDFEIYRNRIVVANGDVADENKEISLADAQKIDADYEVGEEVSEPVDFAKFGRRAILTLRQTLASKILELEHDALYNKYKDRVGRLISAEVYQVWKREVLLVDDDNNELHLPKSVPEIQDGLISIKKIARMPGERAKIAVESYDDRIDPVGACVGVHGSRVHGIVRELDNENIDVINWSANTKLFIQRALSPAQVTDIKLDEENHKASVYLQPDQVSLAIGRNGMNIKLASMLTEYTIDVFRVVSDSDRQDQVDDVYLDQFNDEIDQWIIDAIKGIGLETAREVLNAPREMLVEKADLEEETVDHVLEVLRKEFEQ